MPLLKEAWNMLQPLNLPETSSAATDLYWWGMRVCQHSCQHTQAQLKRHRVKLWVTLSNSSDHPEEEQREDSHVHTCLHFFIGIPTLCMYVCVSNAWSSVWKCRTKRERNRHFLKECVIKIVGKKMTHVFQSKWQSCKLILGTNNLISVLFTVTFFKHISHHLKHTSAKMHEGQVS